MGLKQIGRIYELPKIDGSYSEAERDRLVNALHRSKWTIWQEGSPENWRIRVMHNLTREQSNVYINRVEVFGDKDLERFLESYDPAKHPSSR